jgi:hypothetical protein
MSFISEIMAPGGGVKLIPFVRIIVGLLFACTVCIFVAGVARIHMAILGFLSAGLLVSLQMFETAYNEVQSGRNEGAVSETTAQQSDKKTD